MKSQMNNADKLSVEKIWKDLMKVSGQISKEWKGLTALEEIRSQREKEW